MSAALLPDSYDAARDTDSLAPVVDLHPATGFASLGLPRRLLEAVAASGFTAPTAIQSAAIPALLSGRDVVGVAQTGTGKTAAFALPLLSAIDPAERSVQALVLAPTRELALQVARAISGLAASMPGVEVVTVYGGAPMGPQLSALRRGAQIVVGTPGRIMDHLDRGSLHLDAVRFAVLDEADEMLRMGFAEDTDRILADCPAARQTALFSATMPHAIRDVAAKHLSRPVDVSVTASATPVPAIHQRYVVLPFRQKVDALERFLALAGSAGDATDAADAAVVFVRTRNACEEVGAQLAERGISVAVISGDVSQRDRERTIARLRGRQVDVLVATDVAARGLDIERIGLVVNFDAPTDPETYVHRIGRTGRAGRAGEALLFVTPRETGRVRAIERATGQRMEEASAPTAAQVTAHRAKARLDAALQRHGVGRLDACRRAVQAAAEASGLSVTELAAALLAVTVGDDGTPPEPIVPVSERRTGRERGDRDDRTRGAHGEEREDAGSSMRTSAGRRAQRSRRSDADSVRYVVQVGRRHGVRPAGIVGAITGEGGLSGSDLGRIDIFDEHSVVEISRPVGAAAMARIRRATVSGQQLRIRPDRPGGRDETPTSPRRTAHGPRRTPGRAANQPQNKTGWTSGGASRSRGGKLPAGKRDSALPGTPRNS